MDDDLLDPAIMGNEEPVEEDEELDVNGLPKDDDEVAEEGEEEEEYV